MSVEPNVQAELQAYLKEKNINQVFVKLVEALLLNKPDEPITYIIKYLKENYADMCKDVTIGGTVSTSTGGRAVDLSGNENKEEDDEDSDFDSDEEDDDDDMGDLPEIKRSAKAKGRRVSVSAESVNPEKMAASFKKKVVPKSEEEKQQITDFLSKQMLFAHLDESQTTVIVDAMYKVEQKNGDEIIKMGDEGDNFYIIAEGSCECFILIDGKETSVLKCTSGDSFGELALLYNAPRAATVRCTSDSLLWAVDRMTFKYILMTSTIAKRNQYKGFIDNVMILSCLEEKEQYLILDALVPMQFKEGQVIIREGDSGDDFFIIEEGEVICSQSHDGTAVEVCRLSTGAYFGEIALLTNRPRQATVTATGNVKCLSLKRKTFKRVMGPLVDLLKRNISLYNNYMATKI